MSDNTRWRNGGRCCNWMTYIRGNRYELFLWMDGAWQVWQPKIGCIAIRQTLADAKRAAIEHAEANA